MIVKLVNNPPAAASLEMPPVPSRNVNHCPRGSSPCLQCRWTQASRPSCPHGSRQTRYVAEALARGLRCEHSCNNPKVLGELLSARLAACGTTPIAAAIMHQGKRLGSALQ